MIEPSEDEVTRFDWLVQASQDALPENIPVSVLHVRLYPRVDKETDVIALDFSDGEVTEVEATLTPGLVREFVYADLPNNAPKAWWYALDNVGWMRDKVVRGRFIAPPSIRESLGAFPVEGPIENPSPAMPPYETIVEALEKQCEVAGTKDKVESFLSYIQQALHALPESVQGDLACEYSFQCDDADVCLVWCEDEILKHLESGPVVDTTPDGRDRVRVQVGKVYISVTVPQRVPLHLRVEEPAYVAHRNVMAHGGRSVADDMMASGQWTYPTTSKGALVTKKSPGYVIRGGPRAGEKTKPSFHGTWQFIGAWHPGWKSEKDARHWLPDDQGGAHPPRHRRRPR